MADRLEQWINSMRAEEYATAWALAEQTLRERDPVRRDDPALPYHLRWVWDGRPFAGRHCLVRCYHGLGDSIQFARFLPLLARQAASITVEMQARLCPLMREALHGAGAIRFLPFDEARPLPPSECDLEITELDFALRVSPAQAAMPYLSVRRAAAPRGLVGLCHGAGDWDPDRSVPVVLLAPLCAQARCATLMPGPSLLDVWNREGCPFDMRATASLVAAMDLVVTVDTMIAHLAGAMGKPTWLLLKADPDWRWPKEGRATPWYPNTHVYIQPRPGDWQTVLARIIRDFSLFHSGNR